MRRGAWPVSTGAVACDSDRFRGAAADGWPAVRDLATRRDLRRALHVVDERGGWASGGEAMLRALERLPPLRHWARLARRRPFAGLVEPGYRWFARNRARFSWLAGSFAASQRIGPARGRAARVAG